MKDGKDIIIFGNNSILAKNFIKQFDNQNNLITISRDDGQENFLKCNLGDLMIKKELNNICSKIENYSKFDNKIFILFSWAGRPRTSYLENTWSINTNIIINFLEISKKLLPSKIVFISSTTVYIENNIKASKELDMPYPESEYGKQKLIAEYVFENFSKVYKSSIVNLRVSSAYGFDPRFSDQGVINKWIFDAITNKKLILLNSKDSKINFISFDQITKAINISIENNLCGTYNIACKKSVELQEIIREIKVIVEDDLMLELKDEIIRNINIDITKFYSETGIIFKNNVINNMEFIYSLIKSELD